MNKNVTGQLNEALGILKDYPGIQDILDVEAAQKFLSKLEKSDIGDVPDFKKIKDQQIEGFIKESENTVEEWVDALNQLPGVGVHIDEDEDDTIIFGGVSPDLAKLESGSGEGELYVSFHSGNRATFDRTEGTWREIYLAIAKHVNENLVVPTIPQT